MRLMIQAKTQCPHCEKLRKLHDKDVRKAYELGRRDGENRLQHTINIMKTTHRRLYNELTRLDRFEPLPDAPNIVRIDLDYLQKVVYHLQKSKHFSLARSLKKYIKAQIGSNNGSKR